MTEIRLYNTATRRKEPLEPTVVPGKVGMYVCGPTVYDRAHIGNARPVVVFDVLFRLLRHVYGDGNVTYVRNITDVDDKINARAAATRGLGESELQAIGRITAETTRWFHEDMDALGALRPTHEPRATEYVGQMVAMIATLIARGHAYAAEGHVLFSVSSYADYGRLARRSLDEMMEGARVEVAPYKRDPMDFVLWKPSDADTPGWDSPWGRGRPGWHIECSAMAHELLGASFDIHGGGIDLAFPHHENEVAQSRCAHPEGSFARIWMHNGFLNIEGEKMSKSLGNFFTVRDLLENGVPGEVIRFVLLSTHYRKPIDWRRRAISDAEKTLRKWRSATEGAKRTKEADARLIDALADDLNIPEAISILHDNYKTKAYERLYASASLLGLLSDQLGGWDTPAIDEQSSAKIKEILELRSQARDRRDFRTADYLRAVLEASGVVVADGKTPAWTLGYSGLERGWEKLFELAVDSSTLDLLQQEALRRRVHAMPAMQDGTIVNNRWAVVLGEVPDRVDRGLLGLADRVELSR
jgi:cysteinyl-tRNA synthetase